MIKLTGSVPLCLYLAKDCTSSNDECKGYMLSINGRTSCSFRPVHLQIFSDLLWFDTGETQVRDQISGDVTNIISFLMFLFGAKQSMATQLSL